MKMFLISIILISCTSCTKIFYFAYGGRSPKIESNESVINFLSFKDNIFDNFCIPKDISALKKLEKISNGFPEALFFNYNGDFVNYKENEIECNAKVDLFILSLKKINLIKIDSNRMNISDIKNLIFDIKTGKEIEIRKNQDSYIVVVVAKQIGIRIFNEHILAWNTNLLKIRQNGLKIQTIILSLDYMKNWGISNKDVPKLKFK
jgi:hypothetical protein